MPAGCYARGWARTRHGALQDKASFPARGRPSPLTKTAPSRTAQGPCSFGSAPLSPLCSTDSQALLGGGPLLVVVGAPGYLKCDTDDASETREESLRDEAFDYGPLPPLCLSESISFCQRQPRGAAYPVWYGGCGRDRLGGGMHGTRTEQIWPTSPRRPEGLGQHPEPSTFL